jgi:hypothetical protein
MIGGVEMAKAATKATQKYNDKMYDRITIYVKRGEKAKFAELAHERGFNKPNAFYTKLLYDAADWPEPSMDDIRGVYNVASRVIIPSDAVDIPEYFIDRAGNLYCYRDDKGNFYAKRDSNIVFFGKEAIPGGKSVDGTGRVIKQF